METKNEQIGVLFGNISYTSEEQLNAIIDNMEYEQAIFFIIKSMEFSYGSGIYSLTESEILSKSLRIFSQKKFTNDQKGKTEL